MAQVAFTKAGLPAQRVIGTGTLLDSSRLSQTLAARFDVAPGAVTGLVVGEHGDSEVAAFSSVRIGGLTLDEFAKPRDPLDTEAVAKQVREAGYRILSGKGYTAFGIATAIVRICEAIIRDERTVLPVSTLMTGAFGIEGVYLSLPCILGADGVERVLLPALSPGELAGLSHSAEVIRHAIAELQA
jgi:L-lactate dehydrogenase